MKKQGIIFDLDGTLWNACSAIAAAWEEYLQRFEPQWWEKGVRISPETVYSACGKTMDVFTAILLKDLPEAEQKRLHHPCCSYETTYIRAHGGTLYPQVKETLQLLSQRYHLYIVSNCQEGYIQAFTGWCGLEDVIEDTEDYGNTGLTKDANIRLLVERNGLDEAVYVGDTQGDYDATKLAGLPFVFAAYGYGSVEAQVPAIETFAQLPRVVDGLFTSEE